MEETVEEFIYKIAIELELNNPSAIKPEDEFRQLERWDSMKALVILAFINVEYGKNFTSTDLSACKTFRDVYNTLQKN